MNGSNWRIEPFLSRNGTESLMLLISGFTLVLPEVLLNWAKTSTEKQNY